MNKNDRFVAHFYKSRVANKMEKKEEILLKELNYWQGINDKFIGITIPELEYRLANIYTGWSSNGRIKALELDASQKLSSIELAKLDLHNQFIED